MTDLSGIEKALGRARKPDEPLSDRHRDVAWAVQDACERAELAVIKRAVSLTGSRNLCLAGGVALNSKANGLILSRRLVDRIFIQPAATDDGVAIGAALSAPVAAGFRCGEMTKAYLGSQSAPEEIEAALRTYKLSYQWLDNPAETAADLLARESSLDGTRAGKSLDRERSATVPSLLIRAMPAIATG